MVLFVKFVFTLCASTAFICVVSAHNDHCPRSCICHDSEVECFNFNASLYNGTVPRLPNGTQRLLIHCRMNIPNEVRIGYESFIGSEDSLRYVYFRICVTSIDSRLPKLGQLQEIHILYSKGIVSIPYQFAQSKYLYNMDLTGCMINNVEDNKENGSLTTARNFSINLSYNPIRYFGQNAFRYFSHVEFFTLRFQHSLYAVDFSNESFGFIKNFEVVDMTDVLVNPPSMRNIFQSFENKTLHKLRLNNCLNVNQRYEMLDQYAPSLSNSSLRTLEVTNGAFGFAVDLRALVSSLQLLKRLTLNGNNLLTAGGFPVQNQVQYVNISQNNWSPVVLTYFLWTAKRLERVVINFGNVLLGDRWGWQLVHERLRILALTGTRFLVMEDEGKLLVSNFTRTFYFFGLSVLEELYMCKTSIPEGLTINVGNLTRLRRFDFCDNTISLTTVSGHSFFHGMAALEELDLSGKALEGVDLGHLFDPLNNLKTLRISRTGLTKLTAGSLKPLQNLKILDISSNNIVDIDGGIFPKYFPKLTTFFFDNNDFSCDCHIEQFAKWIRQTHVKLFGKDQFCSSPSKLLTLRIKDYSPAFIECKIALQVFLYSFGFLVIAIIIVAITYYRWDIRFWWQFRVLQKGNRGYIPIDEQFDAFVSFSSKDEGWVLGTLVKNLEESEAKFQLCLANRNLIPGNFIIDNLVHGIEQSKCCIFVVTKNFIQSEWCNFELNTAVSKMLDERANVVILIYLEDVADKDLPKTLRRLKKHVTHIKWPKCETLRQKELFWKKLQLVLFHKKEAVDKNKGKCMRTVAEESV